jgi:ABC-2 type transport system permease protein|tara:strand:+ start:1901 stop:2662 length:762 start_codon:yes stop_codon:yes gene_type:complete
VFFKVGVLNEMAYRANFWIQLFESLLGLGTALATVFVVFAQTDQLGGWHRSELISLLGIYFLVLGSINFVIAPSLSKFMQDVVDGNLDFTLTKPADSQLLVSISEFRIWKLIDVIMGFIVLGVGLSQRAAEIGLQQALVFGVSLVAAGAIVYSFWVVLATLAFWFIRIENITQVFWAMYVAGRWPVTIYPDWLRWILTMLVPIAFAVTVPAQAVSGRLDGGTLGGAILLAAALLIFSRWFWKIGVRFYAGASA